MTAALGKLSESSQSRRPNADHSTVADQAIGRLIADGSLLQQAFAVASVGMAVVTPTGFWRHVNPRVCDLLGYSPGELATRRVLDLMHPDDVAAAAEEGRAALAGGSSAYRSVKRFVHAEGFIVWTGLDVRVIHEADGAPDHLFVQFEDLTNQYAIEATLAELEQKFRYAFHGAPVGVAIVGLDGRSVEVNDSLCSILGYPRNEMQRRSFEEITHPADIDADLQLVDQLLTGQIPNYSLDKRYIAADGRVVWAKLSVSLVRSDDGRPQFFVSHVQDVTAERAAQDQLAYLATHDQLTGLVNRSHAVRQLTAMQQEADDNGGHVAVVFIDLQGFKAINDRLGHHAGDQALSEIARRLAQTVHPADVPARLGGDEFVVCLSALSSHRNVAMMQGSAACARIVDAIAVPMEVAGHTVEVQASAGLALCQGSSEAATSLIRRADEAMYRSRDVRL
jgi:diguanylate cyclase (GGDEF)-like protein/PAS domain S-box-containing protein